MDSQPRQILPEDSRSAHYYPGINCKGNSIKETSKEYNYPLLSSRGDYQNLQCYLYTWTPMVNIIINKIVSYAGAQLPLLLKTTGLQIIPLQTNSQTSLVTYFNLATSTT